jgi:hypothetical protein
MGTSELPEALRRAVEADHTLVLKIAAEACLSQRSVTRCLAGDGVRANTRVAIVRAWERLQKAQKSPSGPPSSSTKETKESRLADTPTSPKSSRLEDASSKPPSRLEDAPKGKKRKPKPKLRLVPS